MKSLLAAHAVVALDSSLFIYHFESHPSYRALTGQILHSISRGSQRGVVSELTLLELLVRPLQLQRQEVADEYEALLTHFPNLTLVPLSRRIILEGAALRARHSLRTPDALILATALTERATLVLANDRHWQRVTGVTVACLDDYC